MRGGEIDHLLQYYYVEYCKRFAYLTRDQMEIKSQTTTTTLDPTTETAVFHPIFTKLYICRFFGTSVGITVGRHSGCQLAMTLVNSYFCQTPVRSPDFSPGTRS